MDDSWNAIRTGAFLHRDYTGEYGCHNEPGYNRNTVHYVWDLRRIHSGLDCNKSCILFHILSDKGIGRIFIIEQYARNTAKIMKE